MAVIPEASDWFILEALIEVGVKRVGTFRVQSSKCVLQTRVN